MAAACKALALAVALAGALAAVEPQSACDVGQESCIVGDLLLQKKSLARKTTNRILEVDDEAAEAAEVEEEKSFAQKTAEHIEVGDEAAEAAEAAEGHGPWVADHTKYDGSMVMAALVKIDGSSQTKGTLGAFIGTPEEVRGVSNRPLFPPFGAYKGQGIWPIMIHGEAADNGATITFKFMSEGGGVTTLDTTMTYTDNGRLGNFIAPKTLTYSSPTPAPTTAAPTTAAPATAAPVAWAVTPSDFSDSMTAQVLVTVGGVDQSSGTLAAFSEGGACVGVQSTPLVPPFGPHAGKSIYAITVFGNGGGDENKPVTFKWRMPDGSVKTLAPTLPWASNANHGNVIHPLAETA